MYVLGIESSANKLGIALLHHKKIIYNQRKTFITNPGYGFIPSETADHHFNKICGLLKNMKEETKIKLKDLNLITFTRGPGMAGPLQVGALVARSISLFLNVPIVPVNHCVAHIEMGIEYCNAIDPVILYASGGNTQIIAYNSKDQDRDSINEKDNDKDTIKDKDSIKDNNIKEDNFRSYKILGETLDIAVGNCLDRFARICKISNDPSPGYNIELLAKKSKKYVPLPIVVKGMDISLSGTVSFIENIYNKDVNGVNYKDKNINKNIDNINKDKNKDVNINKNTNILRDIESLSFSLQETIFSALVEVTERALSLKNSKEVLIVGGVGCNQRLQQMMEIMCKERNAKLHAMDDTYCVDNGAMIGHTGLLMYLSGERYSISDTGVTQRWRTDSVNVTWK